jgi:hypothetical protein
MISYGFEEEKFEMGFMFPSGCFVASGHELPCQSASTAQPIPNPFSRTASNTNDGQ